MGIDALVAHILSRFEGHLSEREALFGADVFSSIVRYVSLQALDNGWKEHLLTMDRLKEGIGLRGYGQKDPLVEYKREGFDLFEQFMEEVENSVVEVTGSVREVAEAPEEEPDFGNLAYSYPDESGEVVMDLGGESFSPNPFGVAVEPVSGGTAGSPSKIGRNDPCPCGSGKKYKKCHGAV